MKKPYSAVFTGRLASGADVATVKSNLILSLGISEERAAKLFGRGEVLLKHFASAVEAEQLAELFYQAGAICEVRDSRGSESHGVENSGESSLVRVFKHFAGNRSVA